MAGRPTKKTPEVIRKIEEVAAIDGTVGEMAFYANINRDTIYDWLKKDKKFSDRIKALREEPILKARNRVMRGIEESYSNAMDYLKRKKRLEFGDNIDVTTLGKELPKPIIDLTDDICKNNSNKKDNSTKEKD